VGDAGRLKTRVSLARVCDDRTTIIAAPDRSVAATAGGREAGVEAFLVIEPVYDEYGEIDPRCPACGSGQVDEFRMGVIRYRIAGGVARFERVMEGSEDTIYRRCVDCGYGSETCEWEHPRPIIEGVS
jgi:hypothetical protein